jgi:O-antigen/teichoic acid export membrane protein
VATGGIAAFALLATQATLTPTPSAAPIRISDIREGLGFSAVWAVANALTSLDKTLVLRFAGSTTTGLYAAAYRLATMFALPIDALTMAVTPRLFRRGDGDASHPHLLRHLVAITLSYTLAAEAALWLAAELLPVLLGQGFKPAVSAARWLTLFLPCYGLRVLGSNVLLASGLKRLRIIIEGLGMLSMLLFALLWLPGHGLNGAVTMIIASEATLAMLTWATIWLTARTKVQPHKQNA